MGGITSVAAVPAFVVRRSEPRRPVTGRGSIPLNSLERHFEDTRLDRYEQALLRSR